MRKRVLLFLLPIFAALLGWWWLDSSKPMAIAAEPMADPANAAAVAGAASMPMAASGTRSDRTIAESEPTLASQVIEPEGGLLVRVAWSDGTPAPRVNIYVARRLPGASRPLAELVSDDAGEARARVSAGRVTVSSDRGDRVEAELVAGREQEVRLQLASGVGVEGSVRDGAGAPVPGARIWLTSFQSAWCAGAFVAESDAQGEFRLQSVPKDQSLGAVAAGRAPSKLVDLELRDCTRPPVRIELVLADSGGALAGRVADADGNGVGGAIVAVGKPGRLVEPRTGGGMEERWAPRRATSAADGRFALAGLAAGRHPVEVWAREFPYWRGECAIEPGATAQLDVTLPRPVTVQGVVTGEDDQPLAGAIVRVFPIAIAETFLPLGQYDYESTFGGASAVADGLGRYRLLRAPPGELHLYAGVGGQRGFDSVAPWADEVMQAEPGAVLEWNPKLDPGPTIRGVVRHRDGVPMPGLFVNLHEPGQQGGRVVVTDKQGRFRFLRLRPKAYDLSVQLWSQPKGSPPVEAREVWPGPGELVLTAHFDSPKKLAKGSVRGVVSDAAGRLAHPGALAVILANDEGSWRTRPKLDGSAFRFDDIEPGRRRVIVMSGEDPILVGPWFELQPAEHKDVGTLVTEPGGKISLRVVRQPGTEDLQPELWVTPVGASHGRKFAIGQAAEVTIDNLSAGEHGLSAHANGMAQVRGRCTVVAGGVAQATIELRAAASREIVVEYAAEQRVTRVRVWDDHGADVLDFAQLRSPERPFRVKPQLPLGRFKLMVETEGGGRAELEFEMKSLAAGQPPIVLQAK